MTKRLSLRKAKETDARFVLSLKNSMRKYNIVSQKVISLKTHLKWFSENFQEFQIIRYGNKDIGFLRAIKSRYGNEIGIYLLKEYRNKGIGTKMIEKTTGCAIMRVENTPSFKAFLKAGYRLVGFYVEKQRCKL